MVVAGVASDRVGPAAVIDTRATSLSRTDAVTPAVGMPWYFGSALVAALVTAQLPVGSTTWSSTAETVKVWATFQFAAVKATEAGATEHCAPPWRRW